MFGLDVSFFSANTAAPSGPAIPADLMEKAKAWGQTALDWLNSELLQVSTLIQGGVIVGVLFAGVLLSPIVRRWLKMGLARLPEGAAQRISEPLHSLLRPLLWVGGFFIAQTAMQSAGQPMAFVRLATSLSIALLIIRFATSILPKEYRKPVAWLAWIIAGLNVFGLIGPTMNWLNTNGIPFGEDNLITLPFVVRAIVFCGLFVYAANWLSKQLRTRIDTLPRVEPSLRVLLSNATHVGLFIAAGILALTSLGIPLGGLAVLGGALGVGLGFGMQQIVANFVSGIILLTDRSIKPNDVIEVDDDESYGVVKSLGLRYASVVTRDGTEHLIPNETLVTNKVVNWSYSNSEVRIKRRFRVEYESDLKLAIKMVIEGAKKIDRVLADPAPNCLVMDFGEDAIEIEARFWISDPQNGINNVASEVMLAVWDLFQEHGIDIPLRQDEILIQPGSTIDVRMAKD